MQGVSSPSSHYSADNECRNIPTRIDSEVLQPFNAWLPMTYSVSGLKAVVSSGDFNFMWQNVGVLMIFIVVLSLGTIASLTWMHKRQFRNIAENQSIEA